MPTCCVADRCLCPNAPLDGRHFCAICKKELHGPCGVFNGDDAAITYRNRCFLCLHTTAIPTPTSTGVAPLDIPVATQQSAVISAKDVNPRRVTWDDIKLGLRPSMKSGEGGQTEKSTSTICGIDAMSFSTDQLRLLCVSLKLTGYRSQPKAELLRIIAVGKVNKALQTEEGNTVSDGKVAARTKNCSFRFINILFSDEMSTKFLSIASKKDKDLIDFWQEVSEKYQEDNAKFAALAWQDALFKGVDPSVRLPHSWSKLRDIYKGLIKSYGEVYNNHKKSGNHDDFVNFCGNRGELYYLHLWLQKKPQLKSLVVIDLPQEVVYDSGKDYLPNHTPRRSPTETEMMSFELGNSITTLAASINALVDERRKSREQSHLVDMKLNEEKLRMQISCNLEENLNRLIETKRKLETETNPGIIKVLKKYEKRLNKVIDLPSSSSDSGSE